MQILHQEFFSNFCNSSSQKDKINNESELICGFSMHLKKLAFFFYL
jgi:hypothetical protein